MVKRSPAHRLLLGTAIACALAAINTQSSLGDYHNDIFDSLQKSRDALLGQRDELQKARTDCLDQIDRLNRKIVRIDTYLKQVDDSLKDIDDSLSKLN